MGVSWEQSAYITKQVFRSLPSILQVSQENHRHTQCYLHVQTDTHGHHLQVSVSSLKIFYPYFSYDFVLCSPEKVFSSFSINYFLLCDNRYRRYPFIRLLIDSFINFRTVSPVLYCRLVLLHIPHHTTQRNSSRESHGREKKGEGTRKNNLLDSSTSVSRLK